MLLNPEMADAFGDWLDLTRLRRMLTTTRPSLDGAVSLDSLRPLMRIQRRDGDALLVARTAEEGSARWLVGVPHQSGPVLHEADTTDGAAQIVLAELDGPSSTLAGPRPMTAGTDASTRGR